MSTAAWAAWGVLMFLWLVFTALQVGTEYPRSSGWAVLAGGSAMGGLVVSLLSMAGVL